MDGHTALRPSFLSYRGILHLGKLGGEREGGGGDRGGLG